MPDSAPPPTLAATLLLLRRPDPRAPSPPPFEVFCVQRTPAAAFLGGAIVFPGGKLEAEDSSWPAQPHGFGAALQAPALTAIRETLEEAGIALVDDAHGELVDPQRARALRDELAARGSLHATLTPHHYAPALHRLRPFGRWLTPAHESRRFDTWFFVAEVPRAHRGEHDGTEVIASFWASPGEILARHERAELRMVPPTHRSLQLLASCSSIEEVLTLAQSLPATAICPELVREGEQLHLVLPGDPAHSCSEPRLPFSARYTYQRELWLPAAAPSAG